MKTIIVGAGFGGLSVANVLKNSNQDVLLIDKNNYHLFQPLLYQVAVSALSPGDIAYPVRAIFRKANNIRVLMDEVVSVDLRSRRVEVLSGEKFEYDFLILAPGATTSYFGNEDWKDFALPLKTLPDALEIRERILISFEEAEKMLMKTQNIEKYLSFVIVGGGPTGVELAGAIAELIYKTILPDFPLLRNYKIKIILIDSGNKLLSSYPDELSTYTYRVLTSLGVEIYLNTRVVKVGGGYVETNHKVIVASNIFWAAGNSAPPILKSLNVKLDRQGRVVVNPDMSIPGFPDAFVIGDSASFQTKNGETLPAIAPVAIQQGIFVGKIIHENLPFGLRPEFVYRDKGIMATIGKARAVALLKGQSFKGWVAWLLWSFVHILFLIGFRNKLRVVIEWLWYYITNKSGARLIVNYYRKKRVKTS
ncbi:MAG: NAD(P)/FAD-dependent oxidoreductase [Candidatus Kapaibacteriota bacterium]